MKTKTFRRFPKTRLGFCVCTGIVRHKEQSKNFEVLAGPHRLHLFLFCPDWFMQADNMHRIGPFGWFFDAEPECVPTGKYEFRADRTFTFSADTPHPKIADTIIGAMKDQGLLGPSRLGSKDKP